MPTFLALHIPDGFLSNPVAALCWIPTLLAVGYALRRAGTTLDDRRVPLLGVTAAFIFAAQMLNFPIAGGTSGHFLGATLAAVLLGPWLACLVMFVVLAVQAFLFADGGITALGANTFNMGVLGALLAGGLIWGAWRMVPHTRGWLLGTTGVTAWLAVMAGALATSIELGSRRRCRSRRCSRRCWACTRSSASARRSSRWPPSAPSSPRGPT